MHLSVYEQCEIFYFAFVFGIFLGVYYDFYRMLRYLGLNSKAALIVQDIIFMTTSGVFCFLFSQVTVNGHLRAFTVVAHLCGAVSYRYSVGMLSGYVFKLVSIILELVKKIVKKIYGWLVFLTEKMCCNISHISHVFDSIIMIKPKSLKKFETNSK